MRILRETPWWGYALVAASFVAGMLLTWFMVEQSRRTDDIQQARLESCRHTYEGIREVFAPFLPGAPADRVALFNRTVDRLKAGCEAQTDVRR